MFKVNNIKTRTIKINHLISSYNIISKYRVFDIDIVTLIDLKIEMPCFIHKV